MGKFADKGRLPINVEGDPHTIYIHPEMTVAMRSKLISALKASRDTEGNTSADMGEFQMTQLEVFICGWSGPEFDGVECTPATVRELKANDPLVKAALEEIGRRHPLG